MRETGSAARTASVRSPPFLCVINALTHILPHRETSGRNTWSKAFPTSFFLGQKRPQSLIPQRLEGILSPGKDEAGGSNPPSSSILTKRYRCVWRKARRINRFRAFSGPDFFFQTIDANRCFRASAPIRTGHFPFSGRCIQPVPFLSGDFSG